MGLIQRFFGEKESLDGDRDEKSLVERGWGEKYHEPLCAIRFLETLGVTKENIDRFPDINNGDYFKHFEDLRASPTASLGTFQIKGKYITQPKEGSFKESQRIPGDIERWEFKMFGPQRGGYSLEIERIE
jgi:hypothetical protein